MERSITALLAPGKGILAADESLGTMGRRFAQVGLPNHNHTRAAWRQLILTTPLLERYISGVILSDETLQQPLQDGGAMQHPLAPPAPTHGDACNGSVHGSHDAACAGAEGQQRLGQRKQQPQQTLAQALASRGIQAGIKVDLGTEPFALGSGAAVGEVWTRGLEDLVWRCRGYAAQGATFAKWRAVFHVGTLGEGEGLQAQLPSQAALERNARDLAAFASAAQRAGLVPIVEPELLVAEGGHDVAASAAATARVLSAVAAALLKRRGVDPSLVIVKPNMILPGSSRKSSSSGDDGDHASAVPAPEPALVGAETMAVLRRLQEELPGLRGVAFLSGGQGAEEAVLNLHAINTLGARQWEQQQQQQQQPQEQQGGRRQPLVTTFSFGRALLQSALELWSSGLTLTLRGEEQGTEAVQEAVQAAGAEAVQAVDVCGVGSVGSCAGRVEASGDGGEQQQEQQQQVALQQRVQAELLRWCRASSRAVQGLPPLQEGQQETALG